jgi:catechol 2,3-dioxygenase-like lactoylglutathione lyase family enzyme
MYDHIGLKAKNVPASTRFYKAALAPLGFVLASGDDTSAGFGPKDAPAFWLGQGKPAESVHIAFAAKDHASVDGFHKAGLKAGGRDNGAPGPRPDYGPKYYAAFLIDPDGNNVEAVCLK